MGQQIQTTAYLVAQANRAYELAYNAALRGIGLSLEQARLLEALRLADGRAMGDLAARTLVDPPTMTKMIDKLVSAGLVYRAPDPDDRRKVLAYLSETGREIEGRAAVLMAEVTDGFAPLLLAREEAQLRHLLQRLIQQQDD